MGVQRAWIVAVVALDVAACGRIAFDAPPPDGTQVDVLAPPAPVAHYAMDDAPDDGVADAVGPHRGACNAGECPTVVGGRSGSGYRFDGTDDLVRILSGPDFTPAAGFAVTAWVFLDAAPPARACVASKPLGASTTDSWALCIEPDLAVFFFTCDATCDPLRSASGTIEVGAWQHVGIVFDGTTKQIWHDAAEVQRGSGTVAFDDREVLLGGNLDGGASHIAPFPGVIDEVRIFDRALSAAELATLLSGS